MSSIALGLSVSKPLMALGLFGLLIVWLIDGNLKEKIKAFYNNKTALIISSIYLLTVLGFFWTSNLEFAIDDLRRKLPIFFIPFYVSGFSPITKKELHLLLKVFIAGVLISTFWSLFVYLGGLNINIVDKRDLSRFNSHIRFGLAIALTIFFCFYYFFHSQTIKKRVLWLGLSCWLITSLFLFSLFTGLVVFVITGVILLFVFGIRASKNSIIFSSILVFIALFLGGSFFLSSSIKDFNESNIPKTISEKPFTKEGNKYRKDKKTEESTLRENGYFVEKHISDKEFSDAWNNRSDINYEALDLKQNIIKFTLRRFITSKGLRKDAEAINSLSLKEIKAIENGVPNHRFLKKNDISIRIQQILWEHNSYLEGRSFNGHSVLMRWEYWKTAINIIKEDFLFGVGTGDVQDVFNEQFKLNKSRLENKYRLRTHNQFLAYGVSYGLIGLFWFIICLFYPFIKFRLYKNYIYFAFLSIIILSMISEDTLETQAGINLFAFFNTLFLLRLKENITN
ncbi:MAG: hypothetical protein COB15_04795 [Flavobacteriales bacterium]|nr:MAG: hypothetical protein COB15_04795 [Flavobacteriales bacterium]